ncbi:hypothetical protein B0H17DRAFT_1202242 [Mycena rosella]|uniref:F-box domain-containing protein n=1 Tax=Mycena rosella TaxID=1033263 RepID=A0AAD7DE73_MYCRO|nr:hypothetical protein B0H17DRAFT_1202242 [Mycena rosella]
MRKAPWLLSHVCRRWRAVAILTPMLWRFLTVSLKGSRERRDGVLQLMTLFLDRSSPCPISLDIRRGYGSALDCTTLAILEILMNTSDRWEALRIIAKGIFIQRFSPTRSRLPRLRHLELTRYETFQSDISPAHIDAFADAPRLHHVIFSNDQPLSVLLPWRQLTEFHTSYDELDTILKSLRDLVNVVTLKLDQFDGSCVTEQPPVHLPRLHILSLISKNEEDGWAGDIFDYLCLPALASLTIECNTIDVYPHITSLVSRSACALESLTLWISGALHDTFLAALLENTPQLTHLSLRGGRVGDGVFEQLTNANTALVPRLASLTLYVLFTQASLASLVAARFGPAGALTQVHLPALKFADMEPVLRSRLRPLYRQGLIVKVMP